MFYSSFPVLSSDLRHTNTGNELTPIRSKACIPFAITLVIKADICPAASMKKILYCSDLENTSQSALTFAIEIAKTTGAKIAVMHALYIMAPLSEPTFPPPSELWVEKEKEITEQLENICREIHSKYDIEASAVICETMASPEYNILHQSGKLKPDLIVLGSRNVEGLRKLLGTTSEKTARRSKVPVLVVPEGSSFSGFKNVIYATDLNEDLRVLDEVFDFAALFQSTITFLHIDNPGNIGADQKRFASFKKNVLQHKKYKDLRFDSITYRDTALAINDYSMEQKADLLIMIKHHHALFLDLFYGSKTKEIIFKADIPVLVFH